MLAPAWRRHVRGVFTFAAICLACSALLQNYNIKMAVHSSLLCALWTVSWVAYATDIVGLLAVILLAFAWVRIF